VSAVIVIVSALFVWTLSQRSFQKVPAPVPSTVSTRAIAPRAEPTPGPQFTPRPPVSLKNGTILKRFRAPKGLSTVTVENGNSEDAVIVVSGSNEKGRDKAAFYVRGGKTFTLSGVPSGTYMLAYVLGSDWNRDTRSFNSELGRKRFENDAVFDEPEDEIERDGRQYRRRQFTTITVSLKPSVGGNARTSQARLEDVSLEDE
jgi:hypothetical protein